MRVKYDEYSFRQLQTEPFHDSFHVRTHFELPGIFKVGQILKVVDSFVDAGVKWRLEDGTIVPSFQSALNFINPNYNKRKNGLHRIYDTVIGVKSQKVQFILYSFQFPSK